MGTVTIFSLAVLIGYVASRADAESQQAARHQRAAFFAAEAAMAEGRARLAALSLGSGSFSGALATVATDIGFKAATPVNQDIWYDLIGGNLDSVCVGAVCTGCSNPPCWKPVAVSYASIEATALGFTTARLSELPNADRVVYRSFVRDDVEDDLDMTVDSNGVVRLVAVGEVQRPDGTAIARQALVALVRASAPVASAGGYTGQAGGEADKNSQNREDLNPVVLTQTTAGFP